MEKEYEVSTLEDILNIVTEENIDRFLADLNIFLKNYATVKAQVFEIAPELFEDAKSTDVLKAEFIWIDDNKPGVIETRLEFIEE